MKPIFINRVRTSCLGMNCLGDEFSSQRNIGRVVRGPVYLVPFNQILQPQKSIEA